MTEQSPVRCQLGHTFNLEFEAGHIPGAVNMAMQQIGQRWQI